jgi:hypothetical protein
MRNPIPQLCRPICHFGQVHPPHHLATLGHQHMEIISPGSLPFEQLRMPRVELGEELVPPIWNRRGKVSPILSLEHKQGRRVIEAKQLKVWHGKLKVLGRFCVGGKPAHGPPTDKGTCTDLWRISLVSFFHVFLSLLNDELIELAY